MAIIDRHIDQTNPTVAGEQSGGLHPIVMNVLNNCFLGFPKASAVAAVFTKQTLSSTMNATSAVGTDVDFPRNMAYQMSLSGGTASSAGISGGTFVVFGSNIAGSSTSETINLPSLASLSIPQQGSVMWGTVTAVSFSNFSLHTSYSINSNSISFSAGVGNVIGLPQSVRSTNAAINVWLGTSKMLTQSSASSTNNQYTVVTGPLGLAGLSISSTLGSGTALMAQYFMSR